MTPSFALTSLVRPTGFEPVACRLGICRSILLSYGRTSIHPSIHSATLKLRRTLRTSGKIKYINHLRRWLPTVLRPSFAKASKGRQKSDIALAASDQDERQLSALSGHPTVALAKVGLKAGAPGRIRTCDLLIRSQALYPTELRAQYLFHSNLQSQSLIWGPHRNL